MKSMKPQVKQLANPVGVSTCSSAGQVTTAPTTDNTLAPPSAPPSAERVVTPVTAHQEGEGEGGPS